MKTALATLAAAGLALSATTAQAETVHVTYDDLDLGSFRHGEAIQKLRVHPEAGLLLVTVEEWLHSGREEAVSAERLDELLAPYAREAPSDPELDLADGNRP